VLLRPARVSGSRPRLNARSSASSRSYGERAFRYCQHSAPRIETAHTHGTGCTYSAAITAELAKGVGLVAAIETAKRYITRAIETNPGLGRGVGPVNHNAQV
jgi:hydroxymethylpyrimidine/phosphomethylpyrimidine kinase